jgi:hypothetical protein
MAPSTWAGGPWRAPAREVGTRVTRVIDRGAVFAAYVGLGMAAVIAVSFLLVIPIEPVYWLLAPLAGLLIGYYADARADRRGGPWVRVLANGVFAGIVTGLALAAFLLAIKALFFVADNGYRDGSLGPPLVCHTGVECVYARYLDEPGGAQRLAGAGISDVASFGSFYWSQQLATAGTIIAVTTAGALVGAGLFGMTRMRPRSEIQPGGQQA